MTLTDELKILDDKIKTNQAQYDLDREVAKVSALSSIELNKYEYFTGEDLAYKPGVVEKVKSEYSPLGEALKIKVKRKANKIDEIVKTDERGKNMFNNSQHNFVGFEDISEIKEMSLDSMHNKRLQTFYKKITGFKNVSPQTKNNEDLKAKVLENTRDLFNELHYI